jgi:hypothetical protein
MVEVQSQRAAGPAQPQPERDGRDAEDRGCLWSAESVEDGQGQRFLVHVRQSLPRAGDIYLTGDEVRVGIGRGERRDVGQSYRERLLSFRSAVSVEDDPADDAEQPGPRVIPPRRQIIEAPPGDEKRLRDHVLGVSGVHSALREAEQIGVRRFVQ